MMRGKEVCRLRGKKLLDCRMLWHGMQVSLARRSGAISSFFITT